MVILEESNHIILMIANQIWRVTLRLVMMHQHTKFGGKVSGVSKDKCDG